MALNLFLQTKLLQYKEARSGLDIDCINKEFLMQMGQHFPKQETCIRLVGLYLGIQDGDFQSCGTDFRSKV